MTRKSNHAGSSYEQNEGESQEGTSSSEEKEKQKKVKNQKKGKKEKKGKRQQSDGDEKPEVIFVAEIINRQNKSMAVSNFITLYNKF